VGIFIVILAKKMERGVLRSGSRFAARNIAFATSVEQLMSTHKRLTAKEPAIATKVVRIAGHNVGSLIQTTVRFHFDSAIIKSTLRKVFFNLFQEHTVSPDSGFEVVVTFNAIIADSTGGSYSIFYGHDQRAGNKSGAAPELKFGETVVVKLLEDVDNIPTSFDQETLIASHRGAFQDSNVHIHSFVNIVYLIYRYVDIGSTVGRRI
jgi:hypothetical protein